MMTKAPATVCATYFPSLILFIFQMPWNHFIPFAYVTEFTASTRAWVQFDIGHCKNDKPGEEEVCFVFQRVMDIIDVISWAHFFSVAVQREKETKIFKECEKSGLTNKGTSQIKYFLLIWWMCWLIIKANQDNKVIKGLSALLVQGNWCILAPYILHSRFPTPSSH